MNEQAKAGEPASSGRAKESVGEVVGVAVAGALVLVAGPWLLFLTGPVGRHNWLHVGPLRALDISSKASAIEVAPILLATAVAALVLYLQGVFHPDPPPLVLAGFGLSLVLVLIGVFSALYLQAAHDHVSGAGACFAPVAGLNGEHPAIVRHWDAIYFSVGLLTTAGTGTLQPLSTSCRELATAQMVLDFTLLAVAVTTLIARLAAAFNESQVPGG